MSLPQARLQPIVRNKNVLNLKRERAPSCSCGSSACPQKTAPLVDHWPIIFYIYRAAYFPTIVPDRHLLYYITMHIIAKIAAAVFSIFVFLCVKSEIDELIYRRKARKHGCESPFYYTERPLGIKIFWDLRKANNRNAVFQWFKKKFDGYTMRTARIELLGNKILLTVDPEVVKTILATQFKDYSLGQRYEQMAPLLGNGIFTLSGDGWKHSRAMLRPQFARDQVSQLTSLQEHVEVLVDIIRKKSLNPSGNENPDGSFDVQVLFHQLTLDTATEFLFGNSVDSLLDSQKRVKGRTMDVSASEFSEAFNTSLFYISLRTQATKLYWLVDSFNFRKNIKLCHNFVDHFVYQTLEMENIPDDPERYIFIQELARQTRDPKVIRDQAFNILLAGRDTTAALLSFTILRLAHDKRVWHKLREVILDEFGTAEDDTIRFESIKKCQYLNYVMNEVLRLHPAVPLNVRTAIRDTIIPRGGGADETSPIYVQKGTMVVYSVHVMHRDERLWGPDAEKFIPERWESPDLHTWDYLPFNGGPRICLGQQFALVEACFTLIRILQNFKDVTLSQSKLDKGLELQDLKLTTQAGSPGVPVIFVPA